MIVHIRHTRVNSYPPSRFKSLAERIKKQVLFPDLFKRLYLDRYRERLPIAGSLHGGCND
jgi:hypothetical protein